jgi:hypothetical protein
MEGSSHAQVNRVSIRQQEYPDHTQSRMSLIHGAQTHPTAIAMQSVTLTNKILSSGRTNCVYDNLNTWAAAVSPCDVSFRRPPVFQLPPSHNQLHHQQHHTTTPNMDVTPILQFSSRWLLQTPHEQMYVLQASRHTLPVGFKSHSQHHSFAATESTTFASALLLASTAPLSCAVAAFVSSAEIACCRPSTVARHHNTVPAVRQTSPCMLH